MSGTRAIRITGVFHRELTPVITSALEEAGVAEYHLASGRSSTLRERKSLFNLNTAAKAIDHPADILNILVEPELEPGVLNVIIQSGRLTIQGRGSVFSEEVTVLKAHELCLPVTTGPKSSGDRIQKDLTGICCIVQRGEGDAVARVALDTGTCVPVITFGHGTGVRDKLGLLRITIPAEKEAVTLISSSYDAELLMNLLITIGKLNQPGKGFIYLFPVRAGQINMRVFHGMPKHAASVEQIIVAIDEMRGDFSWRARGGSIGMETLRSDDYLHDLVSLIFTCNEGRGDVLVQTAMQAGLPGATMTRTKHVCPYDSESSCISPARDVWNMVVARPQAESVVKAMEEHGALDDKTHGQFCVSSAPKAYTLISTK